MEKLESLNYDDVILVEIVENGSVNFKVYVGYYESLEDASIDFKDLKEKYENAELIKILS